MLRVTAKQLLPTTITGSLPRPSWYTENIRIARRHALYKMVSLVQRTNLVRQELGINQAECIAADTNLTLLTIDKK